MVEKIARLFFSRISSESARAAAFAARKIIASTSRSRRGVFGEHSSRRPACYHARASQSRELQAREAFRRDCTRVVDVDSQALEIVHVAGA